MSDDAEDNTVLGRIVQAVKDEGFESNTPEFNHRQKQLQVQKCREMRGHSSCQECSYNDSCELYISLRRHMNGTKD